MTYRQRKARRRGRRGARRNPALLVVFVPLLVVGVGAALGDRLRDRDRGRHAARCPSSSRATRARRSVVYAADGSRLGYVRSDEIRTPIPWSDMPDDGPRGDRRDRGRALLRARGRRLLGDHPRGRQEPRVRRRGAGRLDDHAAARARALHREPGAQLRAQDPRGQARPGARGRAPGPRRQELDPARVPELRSVRDERGADGDRDRGGRRHLLLEAREEPRRCTRPRCSPACPRRRRSTTRSATRRPRSSAATRCCGRWPTTASSRVAEAEQASAQPLGLKPGIRRYTTRREPYFFDYVEEQLIEQYGVGVYRRGGLKIHTTIDPELQDAGRAAINGAAAVPDRPELRDRRDRPGHRLHQGDGLERHLQGPHLQPRRAGPPPAGLGVQDVRARHRAPAGRRPELDHLHVEAARPRRAGLRAVEGLDLRRQLRRHDGPGPGDARAPTTRSTRSSTSTSARRTCARRRR